MRQFVVLLALALASSASANLIGKPGFPEGRIINGKEAAPGEAPYIVSLQTSSHFCAASVLKGNVLITAAHCLTGGGKAVAGLHGRSDLDDAQTRSYTKAQTVVHEKYGGGVGPYDIGLIILDEPFDFTAKARDGSNSVGAIRLPSKTFQGTSGGVLFGWGRDNSGALPEYLQKLEQNIIDYNECLPELPASSSLDPSNVCSYTPNTADGACNGDSGGPLVLYDANGEPELIGIVSWGYTPCATTKYPSVYTKVDSYSKWIEENSP